MKDKWIKIIVYSWTLIAVIITYFLALKSQADYTFHSINSSIIRNIIKVAAISFPLIILWIGTRMLIGKKWAYMALMVYYAIASINIYTANFSFYLKLGLSLEFQLMKSVTINLINLTCFLLLLHIYKNTKENASCQQRV